MLTVLGLPQLVREGHRQVVLADVLLHLRIARGVMLQGPEGCHAYCVSTKDANAYCV